MGDCSIRQILYLLFRQSQINLIAHFLSNLNIDLYGALVHKVLDNLGLLRGQQVQVLIEHELSAAAVVHDLKYQICTLVYQPLMLLREGVYQRVKLVILFMHLVHELFVLDLTVLHVLDGFSGSLLLHLLLREIVD